MTHHLEKINLKKKFFIKSFLVSIVLLIIICLIATFGYNFMADIAENLYGIDFDDYAEVFVLVFGLWKILIIQFTLVPAIALCMLEKCVKKDEDNL